MRLACLVATALIFGGQLLLRLVSALVTPASISQVLLGVQGAAGCARPGHDAHASAAPPARANVHVSETTQVTTEHTCISTLGLVGWGAPASAPWAIFEILKYTMFSIILAVLLTLLL